MYKFISNQKWLPSWLRSIFCEHTDMVFVRKVSAGEKQFIFATDVFHCKDCDSYIYK